MKSTKKRIRETDQSRIFIARILFYLNAFWWLLIGGIFVYQMIEDHNGWSAVFVALFFLVAFLSLLFGTRILHLHEQWVYVTCVAITILNIFLTLFGFPDFLFIIAAMLDLFILVNLVPLKSHYF